MFGSCVFDDLPAPDFCDVHVVPLPPGAPVDPRVWATTMFSPRGAPSWVRAAIAARQALVPLLGVPRSDGAAFQRVRVVGDEALIAVDDAHLNVRIALGVDVARSLVGCTTAVRLKGRRGRAYFAPVAVGHGPVVQAMLHRTARLLG